MGTKSFILSVLREEENGRTARLSASLIRGRLRFVMVDCPRNGVGCFVRFELLEIDRFGTERTADLHPSRRVHWFEAFAAVATLTAPAGPATQDDQLAQAARSSQLLRTTRFAFLTSATWTTCAARFFRC